jgi:hypothetical protein
MLNSLSKIQRPYIEFDPTNPDHRLNYKKFLETRAWKHCQYQWLIDDNSVDVVHFINKKLVEYYVSTDSALVKKRPAKKTTINRKSK